MTSRFDRHVTNEGVTVVVVKWAPEMAGSRHALRLARIPKAVDWQIDLGVVSLIVTP